MTKPKNISKPLDGYHISKPWDGYLRWLQTLDGSWQNPKWWVELYGEKHQGGDVNLGHHLRSKPRDPVPDGLIFENEDLSKETWRYNGEM